MTAAITTKINKIKEAYSEKNKQEQNKQEQNKQEQNKQEQNKQEPRKLTSRQEKRSASTQQGGSKNTTRKKR